jgi:biuret amidohydrolase
VKPRLADLVAPGRTALVTQECQGAVMGPNAGLAALAAEARRESLPNITQLVPAAGSNHNARLFAGAGKGVDISPGSDGATLLPELGPAPSDLVLTRWHGVGPMGGTDLDAVLRNLGVSTIVGVGVSLNIAIPNLVMDAVNRGYDVVLPRDAVAGHPTEYGQAVIANSLALLATICTTAELISTWAGVEVLSDDVHESTSGQL